MANADIKLLFGVAMGGDAEGDSLKEIREGLQQIVKTINDSKELKVVIGLDNAKIEKDWTAQLQNILNNVGKSLKVDIGGVKLDKGVSSTSIESTLKGTGEAASKSKAEIAGYMAQLKPVLTLTSQVGNAVSKMKLNPLKGDEIKQAQDFLNLYSALKKDLEALKSLATETGTSFDDFIELRDEIIKTNSGVLEQANAFNAATEAATKHAKELNRAADIQAKYKAIMSPAGSAINSAQTDISKLYRDPIINTEQVTALGELEDRLSVLTVKYKALTDAKRNAERDSASNAPAERDAILAETKAIQEKINAIKEEIKAQREAQKEAEKRAKDASNPEIQLKREKERLDTLRKIKASIGDVTDAQRKWTASETGKTSGEYKKLADYLTRLDTLYKKLERGSITPKGAATELAKINLEFKDTENTIKAAGEATSTFSAQLKKAFSSLGQWVSVAQVMNAVVRTIRQMIQVSIELDSAMTQLKVVTNNTTKEYQNFLSTMQNVAIQTGSSTRDLIDSATTYARLGYTLEESGSLAKFTTMLQNVGDIDVQSAQDSITAIVKAFDDVGASDIESVMDKLVVTGNNFPISVSQIAEGINNASSALSAAGNTFEESVALLTAANTTIQNASKSSTGLRTIAARLRNTKTELDDLGEEMTTATYEKLVSALTSHSVALRDVNGEFRSTYDIIADISRVWKDISSTEQAALANAIAGTRQQAVFFSLVEQFGEASGAMEAMAKSSGTLQSAYDEYMDSIQAHINQFKAAFETLSADAIQSGLVNGIIDLGRKLVELLDKLVLFINKIGGLKTVLIGVGSALAVLKADSLLNQLTSIGNSFSKIGKQLTLFTGGVEEIGYAINEYGIKNIRVLSKDLGGLQGALDVVGISATSAQVAMGELILIVAAIAAIIAIYKKFHKSTDELIDDYKRSKEAVDEANDSLKTNRDRIIELQQLAAKGTITLVEQEELTRLQEENRLLEIKLNLLKDTEAIKAKEANKAIRYDYENRATPFDYGYLFADDEGNVSPTVSTKEQYEVFIKEYEDALDALNNLDENASQQQIEQAESRVANIRTAINTLETDLVDMYENYVGDDEIKQSIKSLIDNIEVELRPAEYLTGVLNSLSQGFKKVVEEASKDGDIDADFVTELASKYPELRTAMELTGYSADDVASHLRALANDTSFLVEETGDAVEELKTFTDVLTDLQNAYKLARTAQSEMEIGDGGLSPETIAALAKEEKNYLDYLYEENGVVKLNSDAWIANAKAKASSNAEGLRKENTEIEKRNKELIAQLEEIANTPYAGAVGAGAEIYKTLTNEIQENTNKIKENQNQISLYETMFGFIEKQAGSISWLSDKIDTYTGKLEVLGNIQTATANGFDLSIDKAMEFAKVYPEILKNATVTANGQIRLNQEVVEALISGKRDTINAEITASQKELEAEKTTLQAKIDYETKLLEVAEDVTKNKGQLEKDLFVYQIGIAKELYKKLVESGVAEADAYALVAGNIANNFQSIDKTAASVLKSIARNTGVAANAMDQAFYESTTNIKDNIYSVYQQSKAIAQSGFLGLDPNTNSALLNSYADYYYSTRVGVNVNTNSIYENSKKYNAEKLALTEKLFNDYIEDLKTSITSYEGQIENIDGQIAALEALKKASLESFSKDTGSGSSGSSTSSKENGLKTILDLTKELLKYELDQEVKALEKQKSNFAEIINAKKEMLKLTKEQEDREADVSERLAKAAELQAKINQLALDDSREAQATRKSLEEELADVQKEIAKEQSDYSIKMQEEALDKQLELFNKDIDAQIESKKDIYSSDEKLTQAAIDRMVLNWDTLKQELMDWNYEHGNTLQAAVVDAWNSATEAVKEYGSVLSALSKIDGYAYVATSPAPTPLKAVKKYHSGGVVGDVGSVKQNEVLSILEQGEVVLDKQKQGAFYKLIDFASILSEKLGKVIDTNAIKSVFGSVSPTNTLLNRTANTMSNLGNVSGGGNVVIEKVEVTAPVHVVQKLDRDDIREHSRLIGEVSAEFIKEGFTRRGIKAGAGLF